MNSIFFSRIEFGFDLVLDELKKIVSPDSKILILPWAFPVELDAEKLDNEFFKKGERRYNRYVSELLKLGVSEDNIYIGNCYSDSKEEIVSLLNDCDVLVLPGGNPEMFFSKVVHSLDLLYEIKYFKGTIIGESAGAELQLRRYFITSKNNYYKYFAFYDGFGVIDDPFYMDVHSINNKFYLNKLQSVANSTKKNVYAIYDDGAIIYNRVSHDLKCFGNVKLFESSES